MRFAIVSGVLTTFAIVELTPAASAGVRFTAHGVTARVGEAAFTGDAEYFRQADWPELPVADWPQNLAGHPVLEAKTAIMALSADGSKLAIWTRTDGRITRRGEVTLADADEPAVFRMDVDEQRKAVAVVVRSTDGQMRHTVSLSGDGILEIRQPAGRSVQLASRLRHVLVPSLIGTDLLYAAEDLSPNRPNYIPSLNMAVGLLAGEDAMMVAVWPLGEQTASLTRSTDETSPTISAFSLDTAGQSLYLAFLEHPGIWHEEALKKEYLETDTAIGWKRPFEARWIGRFFIESEGYDFPFYFLQESRRLWGRYIRSWFAYPVWFDGERTMVHFEKKFPPEGRLLIYHLDTYDAESLSPFTVMRRTLGQEQTNRLLDFAGAKEKELLAHRNAVCAMTRQIEGYFANSQNAELRLRVQQFSDDVSTFIKLIRERVFEYDEFAVGTRKLLESYEKTHPSVAADVEPITDLLDEIQLIAKEDLPESSLDEVRAWTDQIKQLVSEARDGDLAKVKAVTQRCRSVAGTQDDMARSLSILAIQLMEEAGRMGTESPDHVRLAEQLITRLRAVLREPSWWEPCRKYEPKGDPGAP